MPLEIARLLLGLVMAACHRQVAEFRVARERVLILVARQHGVPLPAAMSLHTARNTYFAIGIFAALVELLRIYQIVG
jgi:hypothetical protein